jgi:hypothetical protein
MSENGTGEKTVAIVGTSARQTTHANVGDYRPPGPNGVQIKMAQMTTAEINAVAKNQFNCGLWVVSPFCLGNASRWTVSRASVAIRKAVETRPITAKAMTVVLTESSKAWRMPAAGAKQCRLQNAERGRRTAGEEGGWKMEDGAGQANEPELFVAKAARGASLFCCDSGKTGRIVIET